MKPLPLGAIVKKKSGGGGSCILWWDSQAHMWCVYSANASIQVLDQPKVKTLIRFWWSSAHDLELETTWWCQQAQLCQRNKLHPPLPAVHASVLEMKQWGSLCGGPLWHWFSQQLWELPEEQFGACPHQLICGIEAHWVGIGGRCLFTQRYNWTFFFCKVGVPFSGNMLKIVYISLNFRQS